MGAKSSKPPDPFTTANGVLNTSARACRGAAAGSLYLGSRPTIDSAKGTMRTHHFLLLALPEVDDHAPFVVYEWLEGRADTDPGGLHAFSCAALAKCARFCTLLGNHTKDEVFAAVQRRAAAAAGGGGTAAAAPADSNAWCKEVAVQLGYTHLRPCATCKCRDATDPAATHCTFVGTPPAETAAQAPPPPPSTGRLPTCDDCGAGYDGAARQPTICTSCGCSACLSCWHRVPECTICGGQRSGRPVPNRDLLKVLGV